MSRTKLNFLLIAGALLASIAPTVLQAQGPPPRHPAYLHALTDLRAARHYLHDGWAWGPVRADDDAALHEIDFAMDAIKRAAIDDGKSINDPFPIDAHLSPHDRFRKAYELLGAAHADLDHAEDVPEAHDLRNRAFSHIDRARQIVDNAYRTAHWQ